ncbi:hypothetical protein [Streptomyces sp. NPDC127036]|uniref:ATP-dependent DNA ligase n=1 Tax=Streptomyces sp. NPDC127036 TaxID=3347112 RepID=UPI00364FD0CE
MGRLPRDHQPNPAGAVEIRSRQGTLLSSEFPEITTAARDLPPVILDGEIVIWYDGRLAFERLLRRLNRRPAYVEAEVRSSPAHFVAFDLLRVDGARPTGVLLCADDSQEGVGEYGEGDPAAPGGITVDLVFIEPARPS